jgi:hypothetical protein
LSLLLLFWDEELVCPDAEETSPTMVSEKVPPQPIAGNEGNQGERDVVWDPNEFEGSAEVVGGNTEGGKVVVCDGKKPVVPGCCIIWDVGGGGTGKMDWAWTTGAPLIIKNEMQTRKKRNIIFENITLTPNILGMDIL